jgi:hypothetical protein
MFLYGILKETILFYMDDEDRDKYIKLVKEEQRNRLVKKLVLFTLVFGICITAYYVVPLFFNNQLTCTFTR